jgi:hypothetical protein
MERKVRKRNGMQAPSGKGFCYYEYTIDARAGFDIANLAASECALYEMGIAEWRQFGNTTVQRGPEPVRKPCFSRSETFRLCQSEIRDGQEEGCSSIYQTAC